MYKDKEMKKKGEKSQENQDKHSKTYLLTRRRTENWK